MHPIPAYRIPMKEQSVTDTPLAYTLTQAAAVLNVSRGSLYRLIARGKLQVVRPLPDAPRILRTELERFISELKNA